MGEKFTFNKDTIEEVKARRKKFTFNEETINEVNERRQKSALEEQQKEQERYRKANGLRDFVLKDRKDEMLSVAENTVANAKYPMLPHVKTESPITKPPANYKGAAVGGITHKMREEKNARISELLSEIEKEKSGYTNDISPFVEPAVPKVEIKTEALPDDIEAKYGSKYNPNTVPVTQYINDLELGNLKGSEITDSILNAQIKPEKDASPLERAGFLLNYGSDKYNAAHMTKKERDLYFQIMMSDGVEAADLYYEELLPHLKNRRASEQEGITEDIVKNANGFEKAVLTGGEVASTLLSPIDYPLTVYETLSGNELGINNLGLDKSTETIANEIGKDSKFMSWLYQTGVSGLKSAMALAATGGNPEATQIIMGADAATDAIKEGQERGLTPWQSVIYGTAIGMIEGVTERIGIDAFFKGGKTILGAIFKNLAAEGSEEVIAEFFGNVADVIINTEDAKLVESYENYIANGYTESEAFKAVTNDLALDLVLAFAGGALIGSGFGGASAGINAYQQHSAEAKLDAQEGEALLKGETADEDIQTLVDNAKGKDKALEKAAKKVTGSKVDFGELGFRYDASARDVGKLARLSKEELTKSMFEAASAEGVKSQTIGKLTESGLKKREAERVFNLIARDASQERVSTELGDLMRNNKSIRPIYEEISNYLSEEAVTKRVEDKVKASPVAEISDRMTVQRLENAGIDVVDESGDIDNIDSIVGVDEDGNVVLKRESGATFTYDLSDNLPNVDAANADKVSFAVGYGLNGAQTYVKLAPDNAGVEYKSAFNDIYNQGNTNKAFTQIETDIPLEVQKAIYEAGKADFEAAKQRKIDAEKKAKAAEKAAKEKEASFVKKEMGFKSDRVTVSDAALEKLKAAKKDGKGEQYKAAVKVIENLAKMLQVNINIIASETDALGRYVGANGQYNRATNTFTFDITSGMDNVAEISYTAMVKTAGHELTHFIQNWSPSKYLTLKNTTLKFLTEERSEQWINEQLKDIQKNNKAIGKNLTLEQAKDELVADAFEDVLSNIDFAETILRTDKTLFDKIHSWVKKHANDFKKNLGIALKDVEAQTEAGLAMKEASDRAQALYNEWADAFSTALENSTSQQTESLTDADGYVQLQQLQARYAKADQNLEILKLIREVENNQAKSNKKVYLGTISESNAKKIYDLTGIDVSGFRVAIEARQIEHILKDHGKNGKSDRSLSDPADIAKMQYVLNSPDDIKNSGRTQAYSEYVNGRNRTAKTVKYEKNLGDRNYYVVQAVANTEAKTLYIVTAYISKNDIKKGASQLINAKSPNATSENGSVVAHTNMIPQESSSVKENISDTQNSARRITKEQDIAYMDAAKRGDTETAQRMVDEAAKEAGYAIKAYHGTAADFTKFDKNKVGQGYTLFASSGFGFYFTESSSVANNSYAKGKRVVGAYLKTENPFALVNKNDKTVNALLNEFAKLYGRDFDIKDYEGFKDFEKRTGAVLSRVVQDKGREFTKFLQERGYDSITYNSFDYDNNNSHTCHIVFEPEQIKSADPITYDDNGNVILLSERFNPENADIRYSARRITKELSKEQQEFFKDSKVRDENGNLKVMYHGTPSGKFTVFKDGTYFTENKWYADLYQNPGASSISTGKVATDPKTYEVYLNIKKPFDINDAEARKIYINDYIKGGNSVGINPYLSDAEYAKIRSIDWTEGEDLRDFLIDNGYDYDGLVLDEGAVGGYGKDVKYRGKSYVIFSPEQVKNVDNTNPTADPDIRYSARNISRTKDVRLKKAKATIAKDFVESMPKSPQKAKLKVLANNYAKQIKTFEKEQRIYIEATANGNEEIATVAYAGMTLAEVAIDQIETDVDFASMINENGTREKLREAYTREGELEEEIRAFESDLTAAEREVRESKRLAAQFAEREKQAKYRAKQIELRNQRDRNTSMLLKEKTRLKSALDKPSENASVPKDAKGLAEQVLKLVDALNAFNGTAALTRPSAELIDRIMKMSDDAEKLANGSKSKTLAQRVNSVDRMMLNARLSVEQVKAQLSELEKQYRDLSPDDKVRRATAKPPSAAASIIYDKSLHEGLRVLTEYFAEPNIVLESGMYFAKEGLKIVRAMNHQILKANETYIKGKNVDVLKLRDRLYKDALVTSPFLNRVLGSGLVSNILMPKTMIHIALGATENADTLYDMFDEGQMRYIRFMNGARELFMPIEKELSGEKFKTNKADLKTGLKYTDGTEVLLNYDMAMSLIKIVEDADNLRHAVWGGLHIPDLKPYNKGDKAVAYNSKRIVEHAQPESAPEAMSDEEIATKLQDAASKGTELTNEDYLDMYAQQIAWSNRLNLAAEIEAKYKAAAQMLKEQMSKTEVGKQALKALSIISDYYDNYARKHLDEATMEMYGFEKTLQEGKHYYPIRIRKDEKYKNDNEFIVRDYSLENWGNMKHRVNSKKGIELFGAVTELESYMESTAKYYGWTNVIKNMHKILDTQIIDDKGNNTTLIGAVNKLHGSYEKGKFFKNFFHSGFERYMQDLENAIVGVNKSDDKWLSIFHGAFVTNALVLNFSTPLVQYSALPLVAADSGLGSFLKSTAKKPPILSEARLKYIAKYSEVYRYRASGLINADVAAARQNRSKMVRVLSSKALAWTETADAQVLGHQFYALLENVKRTHKGISEERAAQIAGKQLDQTIYDFQANYTVLQRAPVLQGSGLKKMIFGTFRTQQITMFNAYLDSAVRSNTLKAQLKTLKEGTVEYNQTKAKYNESRLRTTKINLAILASNVLNSFIRMGVAFLRHKDDEDERWQNFAWDLLDSYTSMFTVVGEVIGWVVKYYHGENYYNDDAISFGALDIFEDALRSFADLTDREEASAKENIKDFLNVLALFGVPARNAYNLVKALLGWVEKLFDETGVDFDFNLDEW